MNFVVGGSQAGSADASVSGVPLVAAGVAIRGGLFIARWGFKKVTSQKFIVKQTLGLFGLSHAAATKLADPDVTYSDDSGLVVQTWPMWWADPKVDTSHHRIG